MLLDKVGRICQPTHDPIPSHPMMKAVTALSKATLKTFRCSNLEAVITGKNVIYVALLYMNNTPAYYVGKATNGIKVQWCKQRCKEVNNIIYCFEHSSTVRYYAHVQYIYIGTLFSLHNHQQNWDACAYTCDVLKRFVTPQSVVLYISVVCTL